MFKRFFLFIIFLFIVLNYLFVFSLEELKENNLYYFDFNNNGKIDKLEIEFNNSLTGSLNFDKLFLYSNTGGLSTSKLNSISGNNIFSSFYLSGNILGIDLIEKDNFLTGLIINNTTLSHLRLKTNAGVGIFDSNGSEMKLLYTSSFNNYNNVFYKETIVSNGENIIQSGSLDNSNTGSLVGSGETEINTGNLVDTGTINLPEENIIQTGSLDESNTGSLTSSGESDTNTGVTNSGVLEETNSGNLIQTGVIENISYTSFSGKLIFQNPTYLSGKELELNEYNCLSSETDCKVNFNLNIDSGSGFTTILTTKYNCEWTFGIDDFLEEKYKCNPNTITYPEGTYNVKYKITQIQNPENFIEKSFKIINNGYIKPESEIKTIYRTQTITNNIIYTYIDTPKIIIQSGLDENNNCKKEDCSVNLNYETKNSREACLWFFPGGSFDIGNEKKCNPGYIKYPLGNFKITLRVYEVGNETNYKESNISFKNEKIESKNIQIKEDLKNENILNLTNTGEIIKNYTLKISKVLPNPSGKDDTEFIEIENFGTGEINLNGCELDDKRIGASKPYKIEKDILLSSGSTIKFFKFDTNITLNNTSGDEVNLICDQKIIDNLSWNFDTQNDFLVTQDTIKNTKELKKDYKIEIHDLIQTQTGILDPKVNEIINKTFTQKIKKQKSGVKIYGKTFPNIKIIIKLDKIQNETSFFFFKAFALEDNIYETISDEKGNYEIILQKLDIGEFEVKTILSDEKNNYFKITQKPSFDVDNDYLDYINFSKNTGNKKQKNIDTKEVLKAQITLQKLAKGIGVFGNKITCINMDICNINFDGRESTGNIKNYSWDFGNGKFENKPNPKSIEFKTGKYIISLKISDAEDESFAYFFVEVEGKKQIKKENKGLKTKENLLKNTKIDIVPIVHADNEENKDFKTHIFMSILVFLLFFTLSFVILKKEKII